MPIVCRTDIRPVDQGNFHAIDRKVMRHAFDVHNTLGRFYDESIYQTDMARRCGHELAATREVQVTATHQGFSKSYYLDLLINKGVIYEFKAVDALDGAHEKQLINYLFLTGLSHGKLVNFRTTSVESRFISTSLTYADRLDYSIDDTCWKCANTADRTLRHALVCLLDDWGACLELSLYREGLLHLLRNVGAGMRRVDVLSEDGWIGHQKVCLLTDDTIWHLSAIPRGMQSYRNHIARLLSHMPIKRAQWINMHQRNIALTTIHVPDSR